MEGQFLTSSRTFLTFPWNTATAGDSELKSHRAWKGLPPAEPLRPVLSLVSSAAETEAKAHPAREGSPRDAGPCPPRAGSRRTTAPAPAPGLRASQSQGRPTRDAPLPPGLTWPPGRARAPAHGSWARGAVPPRPPTWNPKRAAGPDSGARAAGPASAPRLASPAARSASVAGPAASWRRRDGPGGPDPEAATMTTARRWAGSSDYRSRGGIED